MYLVEKNQILFTQHAANKYDYYLYTVTLCLNQVETVQIGSSEKRPGLKRTHIKRV